MKHIHLTPRWMIAVFLAVALVMGGSTMLAAPAMAQGQVQVTQSGNIIATQASGNGKIVQSTTNTQTGIRSTTTTTSNGSKTVVTDSSGNVLSSNCTGPDGKSVPCP